MKNIILIVFGVFFTIANAEFQLKLLGPSDGVVTSVFSDSLIVSLPPCSLAGKNVDLWYKNIATSKNNTLKNIFTVPKCISKRDLVQINKVQGYQVTNLMTGTQYSLQYILDTDKSIVITANTTAVTSYSTINDGLPGRSAAMIVITVLLSVAMFILIVALIVSLFFRSTAD
ncbi:uroplakin-2-like [Anguilla rostrata]|uniref:uroplakin-2-like n=1 Tax=Anguilla rostrata TaxID=7938 RepID=UPI0030CD89EA